MWCVLQPLFLTLVFSLVFGNFANISTESLPPLLFYNSGLLLWNFFSICFNSNSSIFLTQANIYQKVYYPRLIDPIANCFSGLCSLAIQSLFFCGYFLTYKFFISGSEDFGNTWVIIIVPIIIFVSALLGLGLGLWMSVLTAKYRDLRHLSAFFLQSLMYASPIIFPISQIPVKFQKIAMLNPLAPLIEAFRFALLGKGYFEPVYLLYSILVSLLIFLSSIFVFQKVEKRVVDYV